MEIEYDPNKCKRNREKRGLSFEQVTELDWHAAFIWADTRKDYGEERWSALVPKEERLYFVSYTWRGNRMRIISFRKANNREADQYEQAIYP